MIKCEASQAFYHFIAASLINLIIQEQEYKILFII